MENVAALQRVVKKVVETAGPIEDGRTHVVDEYVVPAELIGELKTALTELQIEPVNNNFNEALDQFKKAWPAVKTMMFIDLYNELIHHRAASSITTKTINLG